MGARAVAARRGGDAGNERINEALVLYTGYGKASFPRARTADLAAAFGEAEAQELKARILALYGELQQPLPEPDYGSGRKTATQRAVEAVGARHPELDDSGLRVLAWAYGFGLR